jgi:hypothetical protein
MACHVDDVVNAAHDEYVSVLVNVSAIALALFSQTWSFVFAWNARHMRM